MYKIYRVEQGDTIYSVAENFGISPEVLKEINGFDENYNLVPNNLIIVPSNNNSVFTKYKVQKGNNMYQLAREFEVPYETLLKLNGLDQDDYIYPDQEIIVPRKNIGVYVTEQGDTLNNIIKKIRVNPSELMSQNEIIYVIPEQLIVYKKEQNL